MADDGSTLLIVFILFSFLLCSICMCSSSLTGGGGSGGIYLWSMIKYTDTYKWLFNYDSIKNKCMSAKYGQTPNVVSDTLAVSSDCKEYNNILE